MRAPYRAALLGLVPSLFLATATARAQEPVGAAAVAKGYRGETMCGPTGPESVELAELTGADSIETYAHEAAHRHQLEADSTQAGNANVPDLCRWVRARWEVDPRAWYPAEAEAYCAGLKAADVPKAWWHPRNVRQAAWWSRYDNRVSFDVILAAFDAACAHMQGGG